MIVILLLHPRLNPLLSADVKKWHKVAEGDTCGDIVTKYKISPTRLDIWNPTINNGGDCKTMWHDYSAYVGV